MRFRNHPLYNMYMMNKLFILLMAWSTVALCSAQLPAEGDWRNRLGIIDQQKVKELYPFVFSKTSPINGGTDTLDTEFYIKIKQLMSLAPYSDYYYYSGKLYEYPNSMYKLMLDRNSDPAVKVMLVEDVIEHGKMYVDHLDSINVIRELNSGTKGNPLTMPLAKIKRAHYNYKFAHDPKYYPQHLYDKKKAYELYREAFKDFLVAKDEQGGTELEAYYVMEYFKTCYDMYKTDEEKYYEQFLTDYQEIVQVCDKLLIPYYDIPDTIKNNESDPKYALYRGYNYWTNARKGGNVKDDGIKALFAASGAGSAERLKRYFAPRLEHNKQNKEFLDNAISFMYANGLTTDTVLYDYCKASYELGKTYENCLGMANSAYLGMIDKDKMREYYMQALDLSSSELNKAIIHYLVATSLYSRPPSYIKTDAQGVSKSVFYNVGTEEYNMWERDMNACNRNLEKMLEYSDELLKSSSLIQRDYVAQAYYMIGENKYQFSILNKSIEEASSSLIYFQKAGQLAIQAKVINRNNVNVETRIGNVKDRIQSIKSEKRTAKQDEAKRKAYEEYLERKKREEAFWNQK